MNTMVDVVVVAAGAAGPVITARLSEDASLQVALVEAGGENVNDMGRMQGAFFYTWGSPLDWAYKTVPQLGLGGRHVGEPRGRVMGGSTAINVGAWMRGCAADYDAWEAAGASCWNWTRALEIFRRIEDTDRGPSALRGRSGPLAAGHAGPAHAHDVLRHDAARLHPGRPRPAWRRERRGAGRGRPLPGAVPGRRAAHPVSTLT